MSIEALKDSIKDYAKDIRLNLSSVLSVEGAPGLSENQIWLIALSCAYATRNKLVVEAVLNAARPVLSPEAQEAARAATSIMAMNNIYYRFLHLAEDKELPKLPARLRMNIIGKPGIDKVDFELACLAVSAIEGCGMCVNAHIQEVRKGNISNEGIQSAVRIASVLNGAAQALAIG